VYRKTDANRPEIRNPLARIVPVCACGVECGKEAKFDYNQATVNAVEIGTLLDRDPTIRGGRPKIAGTEVTVMHIVGWCENSTQTIPVIHYTATRHYDEATTITCLNWPLLIYR
jgi:uncharacterized protein (DUF433 family)